MKKISLFSVVIIVFFWVACKDTKKEETILKGEASITVDETVLPMLKDQVDVFQSKYDAKLHLVSKSEGEALNDLFSAKASIAILTRNLSDKEKINFSQKKIIPKITIFAKDAIALVSNKSSNDTLIALSDIVRFLKGDTQSGIKGIVFDNPNSSTVTFMKNIAKVDQLPEVGVYSFASNEEVIKFVAENEGMIGVIGMNWISQPSLKMKSYLANTKILSVKGLKSEVFVSPNQNNIAEGSYPLVRDLYIINCQGFSGLGMGFASFIAGDIGQRIILKSGLMPVRVPGRKFNIRNEIDNDKIK
ncbi:phosphate ABC transporter substrate-binding protein, PhoT family [Flavobacterium succinicans]|uniref:Phosphate ABC transporter substrate-binding protein, PhoT family n=1 Tax=Flavobacterium succinicans TaxID=29536 RepID=A0A1I4VIN0_9FLAO|nr:MULTISPECIES: substrate-binding domain-containing protein [Flavobacterium]OOV26999.1 phosphate ABC transporter substrate-binding protein [Flavobacterium sp. LM5]SFN00997.1 phosphate ABC transporter substrate-binding protein, PhoT family [Flavobacterium succinicans]